MGQERRLRVIIASMLLGATLGAVGAFSLLPIR